MKTLEEVRKIREQAKEKMKMRNDEYRFKIMVGMGTSGIAVGAREVMKAILELIEERRLTDVWVTQTGEKGLASVEPTIDIMEKGKPTVIYGNKTPEKAKKVIIEHIINGKIVSDFMIGFQE